MIPPPTPPVKFGPGIPRESGDDPVGTMFWTTVGAYSPRERG